MDIPPYKDEVSSFTQINCIIAFSEAADQDGIAKYYE
jgi:hypothetical protein